jgi:signal transduction histidine kinase
LPIFPIFFALMATVIAFGVPGSYLIAIFRYGLWDLDIVVRKTVVYAVLAIMVLGMGFASVWFVTTLFASTAEPNRNVDLLFGAVIGLSFWPLRKVATKIADRFVYGGRATPYEVLTSFAGRVGETYSTDDILPRMTQVLAKGVGAETATVWLRVGNELRPADSWPDDDVEARSFRLTRDAAPEIAGQHVSEVRDQGELLGALSVTMPASDPMTPGKERLVRDLASQAGLVLRNVRLIEELRASRQRLVTAQDEERRKLERDIHDGAQQQLVALAVKLRLADTLMERDTTKAHELMGQLQDETHGALEDLRDLARGIYPPLLADKGLPAALEAQARKAAVPTTVSANGVARYGEDVEAAVYFSCLEALNNIAKYADASSASVALSHTDERLRFVVTDDGRGFDPHATGYGTGLQGIADRLDAIGGTLSVASGPGEGATITGTVPTGTPAPTEDGVR